MIMKLDEWEFEEPFWSTEPQEPGLLRAYITTLNEYNTVPSDRKSISKYKRRLLGKLAMRYEQSADEAELAEIPFDKDKIIFNYIRRIDEAEEQEDIKASVLAFKQYCKEQTLAMDELQSIEDPNMKSTEDTNRNNSED